MIDIKLFLTSELSPQPAAAPSSYCDKKAQVSLKHCDNDITGPEITLCYFNFLLITFTK